MITSTQALVNFLLQRIIDDDEAIARALEPEAVRHPYGDREIPPTPFDKLGDDLLGYVGGPLGEHAARWQPARVLDECAAKVRTIRFVLGRPGQDDVLRAMAQPYRDHPDFREEWRI